MPTELYNFQEFNNNGYCHVMREEYFGAYPAPQNAECFRPDKDFIRMWDTRCVKTVITRRLKGRKAVGLAQQSDAPLIYMPETYWLQPEGTQLPYALLRPSGLIVNEVDHFKATVCAQARPSERAAVAMSVGEWEHSPFAFGECGDLIFTKAIVGKVFGLRENGENEIMTNGYFVPFFCHFFPVSSHFPRPFVSHSGLVSW